MHTHFRPWQDLNLETLEPKSNALYISPQGLFCLLFQNYIDVTTYVANFNLILKLIYHPPAGTPLSNVATLLKMKYACLLLFYLFQKHP